jgi:hypothetical protein
MNLQTSLQQPLYKRFGLRWQTVVGRLAVLEHHRLLIIMVAAQLSALLVGGYLFLVLGDGRAFEERGAIATFDFAQLFIGGLVAVYGFWTYRGAPGVAFWGLVGCGLIVLALDDYYMLHETAGDKYGGLLAQVPILSDKVNSIDDIIILCYAGAGLLVLAVFRQEVFAGRESSVLLLVGAVFAALMVGSDAFGESNALKGVEFPAQTLAAGFLGLACVVRLLELRRNEPSGAEQIQLHDQEQDNAAPEVGPSNIRGPVRSGIDTLQPHK